ncbi:MAG TPA: hypothetical protein VIY26_15290 [Acidimicrobiales bacterium]
MAAVRAAGLVAPEMLETLVALKPSWERHRGLPFAYAWVWAAP